MGSGWGRAAAGNGWVRRVQYCLLLADAVRVVMDEGTLGVRLEVVLRGALVLERP